MSNRLSVIVFVLLAFLQLCCNAKRPDGAVKPMNIIFILTDDHRHDFMGFTGKVPWLQTPALDKMAKEGAWLKNATVTTALCSPSRASILTGQYAHTHKVVDNFSPLPQDLKFFPEYLQQAGYQTGFFGKWHMGNTGDYPQKGFNHWESFKGQGVYFNPELNINGERVAFKDSTYITDLLTDHAIEWMGKQGNDKPFFMYISHKGVHDEFMPAPRHRGLYHGQQISYPSTINLTAVSGSKLRGDLKKCPTADLAIYDTNYNVNDIPSWVWKQRNSWHGVDFLYNGNVDFDDFYYRYCETLMAVDESVARIISELENQGKANNTLIIYMGDNGFLMGEHGLIDKRNMYEESQKIPMLIYAPGMKLQNHTIDAVVQNIDIGPTILAAAGIEIPKQMQGQSFLPLLKGEKIAWRNKAFYEYYWEFSYPQTPTTLGIREGNYKFIFYPGIWDIYEFFDLSKDPEEKNNLYRHPDYQEEIAQLREGLWDWLSETGGMQIPLKRINEPRIDFGNKGLY